MCQTWCLRRSHCARDQSQFCVCCSQSLNMYNSRRQIRGSASAGMHGWPPDTATQLLHTSDDSSHGRQQYAFTHTDSNRTPQPTLGTSHSHTVPHHGHRSLCSIAPGNVPHHTNKKQDHNNTMMNNIFDDPLDLLPLNDDETSLLSMWPPASPPRSNYLPLAQAPGGLDTISPAELSIHHAAPRPTRAPRIPQTHPSAKGSKSASSKSSHISTPALTPQTADGNCSTPDTSVDGATDDANAPVEVQRRRQSAQRLKPILPAPPRGNLTESNEGFQEQHVEWASLLPSRQNTGRCEEFQHHVGPSSLLPGLHAAASEPTLTSAELNDLDWMGQHSISYDQHAFDALFGSSDDEQFQNPTSMYPPIQDNAISVCDLRPGPSNPTHSQFTSDDLFLPPYELETDLIATGPTSSRPYTGILVDCDISLRDVPLQRVELGASSTACGEGSRRDTTRDLELLELRSQGISYREIKQKYGFTEAESTLRGRYRTLTKSKDKRVRKPVWKDKDVRRFKVS